ELELVVAEDLARAGDRVVLRAVEAVVVGGVDAELSREGLERERPFARAVVAGHPGEVGKGERLGGRPVRWLARPGGRAGRRLLGVRRRCRRPEQCGQAEDEPAVWPPR